MLSRDARDVAKVLETTGGELLQTRLPKLTRFLILAGGTGGELPEALREVIAQFPPGALQFEVGVQTFNEDVSARISRRQDNAKLAENLRFLRERTGVHVHADLIVGLPGEELICGGGIAVAEGFDDPHPLELDALAAGLEARAQAAGVRLALEPGRALIARAGTSLYRIMAVKTQGGRRFVIVDGGMADNPRPIIYGARHRPEVMAALRTGPPAAATLVGRSCENDEMGDYALPLGLEAGDLLALRTTGAYTYSMASNYNRFGRPPVVFVRDGHHRLVIRGESAEDVAQRDVV